MMYWGDREWCSWETGNGVVGRQGMMYGRQGMMYWEDRE